MPRIVLLPGVLARLLAEPRYGALFEAAFPEDRAPINLENVILTIASFERTLISGSSSYERYVYWDDLVSFLESLTDRAFLEDPPFENPWGPP